MTGRLIFTVPIYLRSQSENVAWNEQQKQKRLSYVGVELDEEDRAELEHDFHLWYWRTWRYSEIVGYVELRLFDNSMKAYYWFIDARRIGPRLSKKNFRYVGKLYDVSRHVSENSTEQTVADIRRFFAVMPRVRARFGKLHFDTTQVDSLLDYVDLRRLASDDVGG